MSVRRVWAIAVPALLAGCIPAARAPEPGYQAEPPPPVSPGSPPSAEARSSAAANRPITVRSLPQSTPAWIARRVVPDAATVGDSDYTVKPGDTLRGIAEKTGAGAEAIARANGLAASATLSPRQKLHIPGGRYHRVKEGESGIAIARAYGVDWATIIQLNGLAEPYLLRVNQRLQIPSAAQVANMTMEQRAAAFHLDIDDLITGSEPAIASNAATAAPSTSTRRTLPPDAAVGEPSRFAGQFGWPLTGRILTRFGPQGNGRRNDGINIAADRGAPIRAAADGVVAYVGSEIAVYGGLILIKHGQGWITAYGHADELLVKRGQSVKRGQIIGRAGDTGNVSQPQLHFEIRKGRAPVDPLRELPSV